MRSFLIEKIGSALNRYAEANSRCFYAMEVWVDLMFWWDAADLEEGLPEFYCYLHDAYHPSVENWTELYSKTAFAAYDSCVEAIRQEKADAAREGQNA